MIVLCLTGCSGTLYLSLLIWRLGRWSRPPEFLYLTSVNGMAFGVCSMMVFMFLMNKDVRNFLVNHLKKLR